MPKPETAPALATLSDAERVLLARAETVCAAKRARGADVVGVAEWGLSGPTRLTLRCPCGATHVRAVQDCHQAHLCPPCRATADRAKKSAKRGTKREALRAQVATLNARLAAAEAALREARDAK